MQISGFLPGFDPAAYKAKIAQLIETKKTLKLRGSAFIKGAKLHKEAILQQLNKSRPQPKNSDGCPHCGAVDLQVKEGDKSWGICTLHGVRWQLKSTAEGFGSKGSDSTDADLQTLYLADLYQDVTKA